MESIKDMLIEHEDLKLVVYDDATGLPITKGTVVKGNPTIGVGRNLVGRGITKDEAMYLLDNDIADFQHQLFVKLPWFYSKPVEVQAVLTDMGFNLGVAGLLSFKNTLHFIEIGNYKAAAENMLDSRWARQVGDR